MFQNVLNVVCLSRKNITLTTGYNVFVIHEILVENALKIIFYLHPGSII